MKLPFRREPGGGFYYPPISYAANPLAKWPLGFALIFYAAFPLTHIVFISL